MNKTVKILTIVGVALLVVGIVAVIVGASLGGYSKQTFEMREYQAVKQISKLAVEADAGICEIKCYDGEFIKVEYPVSERYGVEVEEKGGILCVQGIKSFGVRSWSMEFWMLMHNNELPTTTIYLPKSVPFQLNLNLNAGMLNLGDGAFEKVDLEVSAGVLSVGDIRCSNLKLELNAGSASVKSVTAIGECEIDVNAGSVSVESIIAEECDLEVSTGSLNVGNLNSKRTDIELTTGSASVKMAGKKTDYNIIVKKTTGSCNVSSSQSAGATKQLDIQVVTGSATINFWDE